MDWFSFPGVCSAVVGTLTFVHYVKQPNSNESLKPLIMAGCASIATYIMTAPLPTFIRYVAILARGDANEIEQMNQEIQKEISNRLNRISTAIMQFEGPGSSSTMYPSQAMINSWNQLNKENAYRSDRYFEDWAKSTARSFEIHYR